MALGLSELFRAVGIFFLRREETCLDIAFHVILCCHFFVDKIITVEGVCLAVSDHVILSPVYLSLNLGVTITNSFYSRWASAYVIKLLFSPTIPLIHHLL